MRMLAARTATARPATPLLAPALTVADGAGVLPVWLGAGPVAVTAPLEDGPATEEEGATEATVELNLILVA